VNSSLATFKANMTQFQTNYASQCSQVLDEFEAQSQANMETRRKILEILRVIKQFKICMGVAEHGL
jgi:hypothetical protein